MKVLISVGTRPNFVKVAQFKRVADQIGGFDITIAHTGQHYDDKMSRVFLNQFNMCPDYNLAVRKRDAAGQIGEMVSKFSDILRKHKPDLILVPGDVNSTLAAAITAYGSGVRIAHLEAGLRSFDLKMPEENNRIITDSLSDYFFVTEPSALVNLIQEGKDFRKIHFVGNTMIDTLIHYRDKIEKSQVLEVHKLTHYNYILVTMHRPAQVDNMIGAESIMLLLKTIASSTTVIFPCHPRTRANFLKFNLTHDLNLIDNLVITDPQDYFSFQKLIKYAKLILTDSGGIQEESTFYGTTCLTLRQNTERPITCTKGTNTLVGTDISGILEQIDKKGKTDASIPEFWDGKSTQRILTILQNDSKIN
jgi:UDP-N-acetylglucosamine 2-epimerase (non-hydrolysing)